MQILETLFKYEKANPTGWNRTVESMMLEWDIHNEGKFLGNYIPGFGKVYQYSVHACFDNNSEGWSKLKHYIDGAKKAF
jgi:hypothetical protein